MPKITTFLTFNDQAEAAAKLYVAAFQRSKITSTVRYGEGAPVPAGSVLTVHFELDGQSFVALNGGPDFTFNESISLVVPCESQAEVDRYWDRLVDGGEPAPCGWLKDRFGVSWQIVPTALERMLTDADPARAQRVNEAMLRVFGKFDIGQLEAAFRGEAVGAPR